MQCTHCHQSLPDDSRFCQFCGKTIAPSPAPKKPTPPRFSAVPATKTVFCRRCGKPIDDDTKRCLGCGKQYFRGIKPMTFLCLVLALALLATAAICVTLELSYQERIHELEQIIASYEAAQ